MKATTAFTASLFVICSACSADRTAENNQMAEGSRTATVAARSGAVVAPQHRPAGNLKFASVLDLNQAGSGVSPQLRGGEVARSADWPASMYATFDTPDGEAVCTAALVGPAALLTAAHCVPSSGSVSFRLAGADYTTQCEQHPGYADGSDPSADYALCKVDRAVTAPAGFKFETISTTPMSRLVNNGPVILGGFGCISDVAREDSIDGRYRIGANSIEETSDSTAQRRGAEFYAPRERNNLLTTDDPDLANLCPGDSGGPAFRATGNGYAQRRIIGVNSRVFYLDESQTGYGSSLISATGGPGFRPWASRWADRVQLVVCGVRNSVPNCR